MRERLIGATVALAVGCGAFVYGLRWLESLMTFHPDRTAIQTPAGAESVWFKSADGTRLHGWFFNSQSKPATATVVFFHGNGGNIGNVSWVGQRFAKHGFTSFLVRWASHISPRSNSSFMTRSRTRNINYGTIVNIADGVIVWPET